MTEVTKEMCCEGEQTVISIVVNNCCKCKCKCKCGCECKEPEKPEPTCPPVTQTCTPPDTPWTPTTPTYTAMVTTPP